MFVDERTRLVSVTLGANCVAARHCPNLAQGRSAMYIVTIATPDQPFINPMVIGLGKIRLGRSVTAIAEIGLRPHQQMLSFACMVG